MRRTLIAIVAAASLSLLAACGSSSDTAGQPGGSASTGSSGSVQQVSVGIIPIVDVAPIFLGQQKGFFADEGIEVSTEAGQGGAAILPGVISGQFEFGFSNVTSLLLAQSQGLGIQVVTAGNYSTGEQGNDFGAVVVSGDSPITSAADLGGKTVAVNTLKNIGDTTVRESIRVAGGDPDNVKFVELAFPDMPAAVESGQVDAAWVVEPFLTVAKKGGAKVIASNFVDTDPNLMIAAYFTSDKLAKNKPELVSHFASAMNKSLAYAQEHPDEARQILTTYTKIDAGLLGDLTLPKWSTDINRDSVQKLADLAVKDGLITEKPDLDELLP